jgi:polyisoprenoid-binding protein YceI
MSALSLFFALSLAAAPAQAAELSIDVDPARSSVEFTLGASLHTVHGSFKVKRGSIRFSTDTSKASGEIVVDMTSGESGGGARDRRMHKEILESEHYPDAVFTLDRVTGQFVGEREVQVEVHGTLHIRGQDHEVTLPAKVNLRKGDLTATATFSMPFVKWGMKNPSTFVLRVNQNVDLNLTLAGAIHSIP